MHTKKEREKLPANLKEIFEEENEKCIQEELNILYVALTRAKYELYISGYGKKGKTWFNEINRYIDIPFRDGTKEKWSKAKKIEEKNYCEPLNKIWWGGMEKVEEILGERETRLFGKIIHAFLEMINTEDDFGRLDEIEKKIKSRFLFVSDNLWKQARKTIEDFLNGKIAQFIFSQPGRNELSVCMKDKTYIVDRVIEGKKILIFDYKTETFSRENIDKHKTKMHSYKKLFRALYPLSLVEAFLVFIREKEMVKI
jgi:ATP-dependent exoDNAse (exonuclease V) beta subunit